MQKTSSFILTGILSFSFYILICILFLNYISKANVKTYDFKPKPVVLELDVIVIKSDKKRIEKKEDKKRTKEVVKKIVKSASKTNEAKPDLKSLFANVKTKVRKVTPKKINKIKKSIDPKRFKSKFEKEKKSSNIEIDRILNDKKTTTNIDILNKIKKNNKETNEYYNKVTSLLYQWIPPTVTRKDLISNVLILIDSKGNFDYRMIDLSNDVSFDNSLKDFLDKQKSIIYPIPEKMNNVEVEVKFASEG